MFNLLPNYEITLLYYTLFDTTIQVKLS